MKLLRKIKEAKLFGTIWWYWVYPPKWGSYLRGTYNIENVPFEFCEIVVYRSLMCPNCIKAGSCVNCGCNIPDKMMDLETDCAIGSWNSMTIEQWRDYKKRTGLKFSIEYGD